MFLMETCLLCEYNETQLKVDDFVIWIKSALSIDASVMSVSLL